MELLALDPPAHGVPATGVYVIHDDGLTVLAGPFAAENEALAWIERACAEHRAKAHPLP
jgi:L-2-hydroxyglutarate oxidase LhgO